MIVTIDAAGRVVVPKALRDELGFVPGSALELRAQGGELVLKPAATPMRLVRRGRGVVAEPLAPLPSLSADEVRAALEASRR